MEKKLKPMGDLKYKARTYVDKDGKEKGVWVQIGTLFSSPHGSNMTIKLDTVPVGEFNGWVSVFKREDWEGEETPKKLDTVAEVTDEPINLNDISF